MDEYLDNMSFEKPASGNADRDCDVRLFHQDVMHSAVRTAANVPRPSVLQEQAVRASSVDNPNGRHIQERKIPMAQASNVTQKPVKKHL